MHSIRVINYWGDLDDLNDLIVIGPYPSREARDADARRLVALPGVDGSARVLPVALDPTTADYRATPAQVADVSDLDGLIEALYGITAG